jgi:hypothetical protein
MGGIAIWRGPNQAGMTAAHRGMKAMTENAPATDVSGNNEKKLILTTMNTTTGMMTDTEMKEWGR